MLLSAPFLQMVSDYFSAIPEEWRDFTHNIPAYLPIIGVLIIVESLLSVDNAAVLATMVMDLPKEQRSKALKFGIVGAYIFRGICLVLAGFLVTIWWLKPLGGIYLIYLVYSFIQGKRKPKEQTDKKDSALYAATVGVLGNFWATVVLVELMDLAFSLDNVFAAVAFTPNIIPVWIGVFIGILAMRFVAQGFVKLMERYRFLEACAFTVIGVLGVKLMLSGYTHFYPCGAFTIFMDGNNECLQSTGKAIPPGHHVANGDIITSILTVAIFVLPIVSSWLFNIPKRGTKK